MCDVIPATRRGKYWLLADEWADALGRLEAGAGEEDDDIAPGQWRAKGNAGRSRRGTADMIAAGGSSHGGGRFDVQALRPELVQRFDDLHVAHGFGAPTGLSECSHDLSVPRGRADARPLRDRRVRRDRPEGHLLDERNRERGTGNGLHGDQLRALTRHG